MGAGTSTPGGWVRNVVTIPLLLYSQALNWNNQAVVTLVRVAFGLAVATVGLFWFMAKQRLEERIAERGDAPPRAMWLRKPKQRSIMAFFLGEEDTERPKPEEVSIDQFCLPFPPAMSRRSTPGRRRRHTKSRL
jgi:hypothetical protein